jgi:hypothetical protein
MAASVRFQRQRVNQVSDDVYGARTLGSYLNRAAFALPALGTFGNYVRNSIQGPGRWGVDLALSRIVGLTDSQRLELRVEAFNLLNTFNWGNPNTNFASGSFGRITASAGDPRIVQFGIKYGF